MKPHVHATLIEACHSAQADAEDHREYSSSMGHRAYMMTITAVICQNITVCSTPRHIGNTAVQADFVCPHILGPLTNTPEGRRDTTIRTLVSIWRRDIRDIERDQMLGSSGTESNILMKISRVLQCS